MKYLLLFAVLFSTAINAATISGTKIYPDYLVTYKGFTAMYESDEGCGNMLFASPDPINPANTKATADTIATNVTASMNLVTQLLGSRWCSRTMDIWRGDMPDVPLADYALTLADAFNLWGFPKDDIFIATVTNWTTAEYARAAWHRSHPEKFKETNMVVILKIDGDYWVYDPLFEVTEPRKLTDAIGVGKSYLPWTIINMGEFGPDSLPIMQRWYVKPQ